MTAPLFPAIAAEVLVIVFDDGTLRVASDWQHDQLDVTRIFSLVMLEMLVLAQRHGGDPAAVLALVTQLTGPPP